MNSDVVTTTDSNERSDLSIFILILQTPSAHRKKSAPTAPVITAAAAFSNKKSPVKLVTAAQTESSESTDISENEENTPAVVRPSY